MKMPTFQPSDNELPVTIKKAFDDGKIASAYDEIYTTACKLAVSDGIDFRIMQLEEYFDSKNEGDEHNRLHLTDVILKIQVFAQERFDYHLQNMMRLVELVADQRKK
jgi:hypothetical protein